MSRIDDILGFWLEETPSKYWYQPGEGIDERIRALFAADWGRAVTGQLAGWTGTPRGALAYIILTDQFPRNMFRGRALSFASDDLGLAAARAAVDAGHDLAFPMPARQFFYLPFTHSENADDQATCVRLIEERDARARTHPAFPRPCEGHRGFRPLSVPQRGPRACDDARGTGVSGCRGLSGTGEPHAGKSCARCIAGCKNG